MVIILGLHSRHDASAALINDGEIVAVAAEERFSRKKHHFGFPHHAIKYVLLEAGKEPSEIDLVACHGLSIQTTLARLVRQPLYGWTPRLYRELIGKAINRYILRGADARKNEQLQLQKMGIRARQISVEHHLAHAAYAYYTSGLTDATVIILDGQGHYLCGGVWIGDDGQLKRISEIPAQGGSLGLFYSAVTDALGFWVGNGEGKTMGLACYGNPDKGEKDLANFVPQVSDLKTFKWKEWKINSEVFDNRLYTHFDEAARLRLLVDRYGEANIASAAQDILEQKLVQLVGNAVEKTGIRDMVGGGGVFLNVKANKILLDKQIVDSIFIPPGPGDSNLAAGYALVAYSRESGKSPLFCLKSTYYGPSFSNDEILKTLHKYDDNIFYEHLDLSEIPLATARLIKDGQVVGWFQGRMEMGPRALGSRSVLADPRDSEMRGRINDNLKKREWFMPFAPSVLKEYSDECFVNYQPSPFMNLAFDMKPPYDKCVPAVMHVDKTARPQEVERSVSPLYYDTIKAFHSLTGIPLVLNTSFNRHGLPIVCTPEDAVNHLRWGCIDVLVIGPFIARRTGDVVPFPDDRERTI